MRPKNADFGITIDFERGSSDPVRVFSALTELLTATKAMDRLLLGAVDPRVEPIMILEEVEVASVTTWIRNKVKNLDDQAIKDLDIRKQFGNYLVKAKYRIVDYLDKKAETEERQRLEDLREDLYKLAAQEQVSGIPMPDKIPLRDLVTPMDQIQAAKSLLGPNDTVTLRSEDRDYELNLENKKRPSDYINSDKDQDYSGSVDMVLLVRKPDYLGNAQWEFKHGRTPISASIEDKAWLSRFRSGNEIVLPGSAISCRVNFEHKYTKSGKLISSKHEITNIYTVIPPESRQPSWLDG